MLEFFAQKIFPKLPITRYNRCEYCLEISYHGSICTKCLRSNSAILMLSGGKDSCFLLMRDRAINGPEYSLLAVLIDNGFMGKYAISNAKKVCEYTNTKLLILDESTNFKKYMRNALLSLNGGSCYSHIDGLDGKLTFDATKALASRLCIGSVICGLTKEQLRNHLNISNENTFIEDGITFLCPLVNLDTNTSYDESFFRDYVIDRIKGLKLDALSTNSELVVLMGILDIYNLGFSSFEDEFSELIRNNKANRQYWVNMFDALKWLVEKRLLDRKANNILKKFDLTLEQVLNR